MNIVVLGQFCGLEVFDVFFVVCKSDDSRILEDIEVSMEDGCAEETYKAAEPLMNATSSSSSVYQIVTNADGTFSLVGLDPTQLDQLLNVQGDTVVLMLLLLARPAGITMPLAGLCFTDDFLSFKLCPCHSTTDAWISAWIVVLTPSMKKFVWLKIRGTWSTDVATAINFVARNGDKLA